jgi:hypothetical protein
MQMYDPAHPGEIVREGCLKPLGLTVTAAAEALGVAADADAARSMESASEGRQDQGQQALCHGSAPFVAHRRCRPAGDETSTKGAFPAQAGTHRSDCRALEGWAPAFTGTAFRSIASLNHLFRSRGHVA